MQNVKLTLLYDLRVRKMGCGAPPGGCSGTAGSGVTVCTGRGGLSASFFSVVDRLSHISCTSSIRWMTWKKDFCYY